MADRKDGNIDAAVSAERSAQMSRIRGRDTKPELMLRSALFARGLRFRANDRRLPGTPDLAFPRYRAVIFVHGCFWHGHDCRYGTAPATRAEFWQTKFENNRQRDRRVRLQLESEGWRVLEVFECSWRGRDSAAWLEVVDAAERWLEGDETLDEIRA